MTTNPEGIEIISTTTTEFHITGITIDVIRTDLIAVGDKGNETN